MNEPLSKAAVPVNINRGTGVADDSPEPDQRNLPEEATGTARDIRALGVEATIREADVADFTRACEIAGSIAAECGGIDFLLDNADLAVARLHAATMC